MLSSLANGFGWAMLEIGHPSDLSQGKKIAIPEALVWNKLLPIVPNLSKRQSKV